MRKPALLSLAILALVTFGIVTRAADEKPKAEKAKAKLICPVSGKEATKDHAVAYKGAKAYFCCDDCPAEFEKNTEKYAAKANAQLVASKQYKEAKCPLTGRKLDPATAVKVAGVNVRFCCNNCKGKVEKAEGDEKLALVFSDDAFKKGFVVATPKKKLSDLKKAKD